MLVHLVRAFGQWWIICQELGLLLACPELDFAGGTLLCGSKYIACKCMPHNRQHTGILLLVMHTAK